jgi:hypothetical protein
MILCNASSTSKFESFISRAMPLVSPELHESRAQQANDTPQPIA